MLSRLLLVFVMIQGTSGFVIAEPETQPSQPPIMTLEGLKKIKTRLKGKRHLIVLWSLDCPPCFKELAMIGVLAKAHSDLPITLLNVDQDIEPQTVLREINSKYGLTSIPHYFIAEDQYEQIKYELDPTWYGELPRSYFVKKEGIWIGKSGLLSKKQLKSWLF